MTELSAKITEFIVINQEQSYLSENTMRSYLQDINIFVQFINTKNEVDVFKESTILAYLKYLRYEKKYSPATVRRRMITLRKFSAWHCSQTGIESPFVNLKLDLKIPKRLPRPIDREILGIVFNQTRPIININLEQIDQDNIKTPSSRQITDLGIRLLVSTGMRIGELTNLRLKDISGSGTRIRVLGKGNKERTVYVANERLLMDLKNYWNQRLLTNDPTEFLFINARGARLTEAAFRKRLRIVSKQLGFLEHLTPHRFRHSAATLLIEEGVDIRIVQRLLGHASIATTELYTQVSDNSLMSAIAQADTLAKVDF